MTKPKPSGQTLLANYQTVFVSQATIQAAHSEASRSEHELLQHLQSVSAGNYLRPDALAVEDTDVVTRASLDAHIKKVQADQLDSMNSYQLQELQQQSQADFTGRKIQVTIRMPEKLPVEIVWFDERNGYRSSPSKKRQLTGTVQEVLLDKNALILLPPATSRMLNRSLWQYIVYVIDPVTCQPMVDVTVR